MKDPLAYICPVCKMPFYHNLGFGVYACALAKEGHEPYKSVLEKQRGLS